MIDIYIYTFLNKKRKKLIVLSPREFVRMSSVDPKLQKYHVGTGQFQALLNS